MRKWLDLAQFLFEADSFDMRPIDIDRLPDEVKNDICGNIAERVPFFIKHNYAAEDAAANLLKLAAPVQVLIGRANVRELMMTMTRQNSSVAVSNYANLLLQQSKWNFDPILIANGRFLDGGHRLQAYYAAGRETIPVVDISNLMSASEETWEDWFAGDETAGFDLTRKIA